MKQATEWVQGIAAIAVIAGLVLVIWELRQSRQVATAQLTSDAMSQTLQLDLSQVGDDPKVALARACQDPNSLTIEDLVVLRSYYIATVGVVFRAFLIEQRSELYEGIWIDAGEGRFPDVFYSRAGRLWWARQQHVYPKELVDLGNSILMERYITGGNTSQVCRLSEWRESILAGSDFVPE